MSSSVNSSPGMLFRIGWIGLLILTGLLTINHLVLIFVLNTEATLFIGWSVFNIYALMVLYIPFRNLEKWAWYLTWVEVATFGVMVLFDQTIGLIYTGIGVVMAILLLMTYPTFFQNKG